MDTNTLTNLSEDLREFISELENPDLDRNMGKLREEILKAKKYVGELKPGLVAYTNVDELTELVMDVEATVKIAEVRAKTPQRSSSDSLHSGSDSISNISINHRKRKSDGAARDSSKDNSVDNAQGNNVRQKLLSNHSTQDLLDQVLQLRRMRTHQPLTSTPAGQ